MTDVIGKGVIEVSADATKMKAGIGEAKKSIKELGEATKEVSKKTSDSIDRYVKKLEVQATALGKSAREAELYRLTMRGATAEQIKAADSALKMAEAHQRGSVYAQRLNLAFYALSATAVAAGAGFISMITQSINMADHLNDLSKSTGISVENLSGLALAAQQSGSDLDSIGQSIAKLSQNIGKDAEAYKALGITAKDPLEAFKQLADIFTAIDDPQAQAALGAKALGKSWQGAAPLLTEGSKAIGEMIEKGRRLSGVTQKLASDADQLNDQLAELKAASSGASTKLAGEMLPALVDITKAISIAYTESGKLAALWTSMGAIGAFLFTDEFASTTTKIKDLEFELGVLEARRKSASTGIIDALLFGSVNELNGKIESVKGKIADLRKSTELPTPKVVRPPPDPKLGRRVRGFIDDPKAGAKDTAKQEASAQLAFDLDTIKKSSAATINSFANGERILEAKRSAALVQEGEYYAAKLRFLNVNRAEQEGALNEEIARLQAEKLVGKDKIDNDRKIADAQSRLAKVREDAGTSIQVLAFQENSALKAIEQGYRDAEDAAQELLNTLRKGNARELAGIGAGSQERGRAGGRAQIEDRFNSQRQDLEKSRRDAELNGTFGPDAQKKYDDELDRIRRFQATSLGDYDTYFIARLAREHDFTNGATEALANYFTASQNVASQVDGLFTDAFQNMEDALVNFVTTGKLDFNSLANSIIANISRIIIKQQILGPLASTLGAGFGRTANSVGGPDERGGGGSGGFLSSLLGGIFGTRAMGGPVSAGKLYQVNEKGPELLTAGSKQYLMMGAQGGKVSPAGGGKSNTVNFTINQSFASGTTRQTTLQAAADAQRALTAGARNL